MKKPLAFLALLAAFGIGIARMNGCFTTRPQASAEGNDRFAKRLTATGVENLGEVAPGVYRGAQPTKEGYESLKKLGVKTIISLRTLTSERDDVLKAGLDPVEIPIQADVRGSEPPTKEQIAKFLEIVRDPKRQPVFFHCAHGKDRTGTMCALYRMEVDGWSPDDAFREMDSFGFNHIWGDLETFVKSYKAEGKWRSPSVAPVASQ